MKKGFVLICISLLLLGLKSQAKHIRVLFIGNSYTNYNNLPELIKQMAVQSGDTLEYTAHTPGGNTLQQHAANSTVQNYIQAGNWDYVVLQEQSQLPSFGDAQVASQVYPYATALCNTIRQYNPCAQIVFYMTWGRKNGDASNCQYLPDVCTYKGMDSLLQLRYRIMAQDNKTLISPVAKVWRKIINEQAQLNLYVADESHPSNLGSYAAACTFYTLLFEKDPTQNSYHFNLNSATAQIIQAAAKAVVYDSLNVFQQYSENLLKPQFTYQITGNQVQFTNTSNGADSYIWNFGDGTSSIVENPSHIYNWDGNYWVELFAKDDTCQLQSVLKKEIQIHTTQIQEYASTPILIFPNPSADYIQFQNSDKIESIQIYNTVGQIVYTKQTTPNSTIDIRQWPQGIYIVECKMQGDKLASLKLIKQ